jgi:2-oxo-4-hydroxy-4-carboxy--5-ureidoimidazoline (OHCU) decarboxylase
MQRFGGGFVKALAEAFQRADTENRARIRTAFPEYWDKYALMVRVTQDTGQESTTK